MDNSHSTRSQTQQANTNRMIIYVVVLIVVALVSFYAGSAYSNHKNKMISGSYASQQGGGFGGGYSRGGNRAFGTVSSVNSSSITVNDIRSGSSKTFNITSSTTILENGASVSVSNITTGSNVIVSADSSNNATRIMLTPSSPSSAPSQSQ